MSSASSPRSDWLSTSTPRPRRPSKAAPVTASSVEVHVDAQPSYGASPEGRAHSRQTLFRHLSQSKLGVVSSNGRLAPGDASRPRSSSSASANSTLSIASSATIDTNKPATSSTSPLSTPLGSPSVPRRRSSAGPSLLPRSPSWYHSKTSKSSLALPELSTIEGSIADLRSEEAVLKNSAPQPSDQVAPNISVNMKRDRTSQDTGNPNQPKRQATDDSETADSCAQDQETATFGTRNQAELSKPDNSAVVNQGNIGHHTSSIHHSSGATSGATLRSWRSYLTLPRSSGPPSLANASPSNAQAPASSTVPALNEASKEDMVHHADGTTASNLDQTTNRSDGALEELSRTAGDATGTGEDRVGSKLDLRSFAAGTASTSSQSGVAGPSKSDATLTSKETSIVQRSVDDRNVSPPQKAPDAINEVQSNEASTLRAVPRKEVRPSSWFNWTASVPAPIIAQTPVPQSTSISEQPCTVEASSPLVTDAPAFTLRPSEVTDSEKVDGLRPEQPTSEDAANQNYSTWSSWLGSYLSKPVETTSITYAAGVAPSITSSVTSSNIPEADETLPPSPPCPKEPVKPIRTPSSPTLQRINPILDVMPRSTWSSFFTTRNLPMQKTIDVKPANDAGQMETMEIDFGSLAASEVIGTAPYMSANSSQSSAITSGRGAGTSAGYSGANNAASATGQASPSTSSSTIKPLTKDKKGSRGFTTSANSKGKRATSPKPPRPNLVLPSFEDTFDRPPRSLPLTRSPAATPLGLKKAVTASISYFFSSSSSRPRSESTGAVASLKGKEREIIGDEHEKLPKATKIVGSSTDLGRAGRVAVIGVHGWFIQGYLKNVVGEPTGTSLKFANMMKASVKAYYEEMGHPLNDEAITAIPLEGDGTVKDRTERLYENLTARQDWIEALNNADRIFIASHSQGTIVSAMLIERLINEGEINGTKCMMLNMCSVSQGPFYSLYNSWTVPAYLYFETAAATELFEFQKPRSAVSKAYTESLQHILNAGVKIIFVASLNDQVVPLYSALFSSLSHPNILRTIFIDSSVFETSADFMTNLVVFSTRLRNAGVNCHGLDFHLSEALMGSLVGVGHSTVYEEPLVYKYAVRYLMETTSPLLHGSGAPPQSGNVFQLEDFNPRAPANPYFLPWALRGIIEDPQIRALFSDELQTLRDQFEEWHPKTKALQQVQAALEPLRLIPRSTKSQGEFEDAVSTTTKKATAKL